MGYRGWLALMVIVAAPRLAFAQEVADPLASAKELNRQGIALLQAGDVERALDYFERSRAAFPSGQNAANMAICLDRLGRYDESLELYEALLVRHAAELDADARAAIAPAMASLREKVGGLLVSSDVGGTVVVDGKPRGTLPRASVLRVLTGRRLVRVIKDGYRTFERSVDVAIGEPIVVDARLVPLAGQGQLRVEDPSGASAELFIDRASVGTTPWEGALAAGRHVVWTRTGAEGSAPTSVIVLEAQTTLLRPPARQLGPVATIRVVPPSAELKIDGTSIGGSEWVGPLPVGEHPISATEAGYRQRNGVVSVRGGSAPDLVLTLSVDPDHPRWPKPPPPPPGHFFADAMAAYAGGATLGSDAEAACPDACGGADPTTSGFLLGARGGYRLPVGVSLELDLGYLSVGTSFPRSATSRFGEADRYEVQYSLRDEPRLQGPFVAAGPGYRLSLSRRLGLLVRVVGGAVLAESSDPIAGTARTDGAAAPVLVDDPDERVHSAALFVLPSVGVELAIGAARLGLGMGAAVFPADGPAYERRTLRAQPAPDAGDGGAVGNARASTAIAGERAYRSFVLWLPTLSVGVAM